MGKRLKVKGIFLKSIKGFRCLECNENKPRGSYKIREYAGKSYGVCLKCFERWINSRIQSRINDIKYTKQGIKEYKRKLKFIKKNYDRLIKDEIVNNLG